MDAAARVVFSVIIPTKNEEKQIGDCLESVFAQDTRLPFEVILVDSSSTPHTRAIGERFQAVVVEEPRPGKGLAVHSGARRARGDILCFTEADCRVPPHWLSAIGRAFEDHPDTVAVTGEYDFHDAGRVYNLLKSIGLPISIWVYYALYGSHSIRGTNFAVRASAYRQAGEFSLQAKEFQDVELGLRLRRLGKIRLVPAMKVTTSARRIQGRLFRFIKEFTPAIYRLLVLKKVPDRATYDDIR
jgi:glycosyltransferase involved in cell wall biosynthesis